MVRMTRSVSELPFGVGPGGEDLLDAQGGTGLHEALGGRLAAVVRDQEDLWVRCLDALREALVYRAAEADEPVLGLGLDAEGVADDFLAVPVQHNAQVQPTPASHFDLGHVDTPELIGAISVGFRSECGSLGLEAEVLGDQQLALCHQPEDALLVDQRALPEAQVGPDATIAPERMLALERLDLSQQGLITLGHRGGFGSHSS